LQSDASRPITLEIFDDKNQLVRRFSSADQPVPANEKDYKVPTYWFRPPQRLSAKAGMHRFVWDLNYPMPKALRFDYPISAIYRDTPLAPLGPTVLPGRYSVKLTVVGTAYTQSINVKLDPRIKTPAAGLEQQLVLSLQAYQGMEQSFDAIEEIKKLRDQIKDRRTHASQRALADALAALDQKAAAIMGEGRGDQGPGGPAGSDSREGNLTRSNTNFTSMLELLQAADATPTAQAVTASEELQLSLKNLLARWIELKSKDVQAINQQLRVANSAPLAP